MFVLTPSRTVVLVGRSYCELGFCSQDVGAPSLLSLTEASVTVSSLRTLSLAPLTSVITPGSPFTSRSTRPGVLPALGTQSVEGVVGRSMEEDDVESEVEVSTESTKRSTAFSPLSLSSPMLRRLSGGTYFEWLETESEATVVPACEIGGLEMRGATMVTKALGELIRLTGALSGMAALLIERIG